MQIGIVDGASSFTLEPTYPTFCSFESIAGYASPTKPTCTATVTRRANTTDSNTAVVVTAALRKGYGVETGDLVQLDTGRLK